MRCPHDKQIQGLPASPAELQAPQDSYTQSKNWFKKSIFSLKLCHFIYPITNYCLRLT